MYPLNKKGLLFLAAGLENNYLYLNIYPGNDRVFIVTLSDSSVLMMIQLLLFLEFSTTNNIH